MFSVDPEKCSSKSWTTAACAGLNIEQVVQVRNKKISAKTLQNEIGLLQSIFGLAGENDLLGPSSVRSKHTRVVHPETNLDA